MEPGPLPHEPLPRILLPDHHLPARAHSHVAARGTKGRRFPTVPHARPVSVFRPAPCVPAQQCS